MQPLAEDGGSSNREPARRGVNRNRSGPMQRGVARNRSTPLRGVTRNKSGPGPMRGVNRNKSGGLRRPPPTNRTRALPLKTNSFHRAVPDRASSTNSLRKFRRQQNGTYQPADDNDVSVASGQTMDSIEVRKKQISSDDISLASLDNSLHTVDSMAFHARHLEEGGPDDISAFDESFVSGSTYMDDYQDGLDGEDDDDEIQNDQRVDIEMQDLKIGTHEEPMADEDEEEEELKG